VRTSLKQVAEGPNTVLGAADVKEVGRSGPASARVLVADDEPTSATRSPTCCENITRL
jgi:hypothetical protein